MRLTSPQRVDELSRLLSNSRLVSTWKKTVQSGLRKQDVLDLHDYMDVHRNVKAVATRLSRDVLDGGYKTSEAETVSSEKKYGITRRLLIPCPGDALLLQSIVDAVEAQIRQVQPVGNAFYSRTHGAPSVDDFEMNFGYPWWILWPAFQKEIWRFTQASEFVVVTDIANYFDSIPLAKLRNAIASLSRFEETTLDFLFYLLEGFVLRPEYIPLSGVGLPQINFDAPRLLAHAYLFPVDAFLNEQTGGMYVRWMDDIDFGVSSQAEAHTLLGKLDRLLSSLGVRLNVAKTKVLSRKEAAAYFWIKDNLRLNHMLNAVSGDSSSGPAMNSFRAQRARRFFGEFQRRPKVGHRDKVQKRFFNLFGKLGLADLEKNAAHSLFHEPGLRASALNYFRMLGFSLKRLNVLLRYLASPFAVDDASVFGCAQIIVEWQVPITSVVRQRIVTVCSSVRSDAPNMAARFGAALWMLCKYGSTHELGTFVSTHEATWSRSHWASRQVAGAVPMLDATAQGRCRRVMEKYGLLDALSVDRHLNELAQIVRLDSQLTAYLGHQPALPYNYPLPKFVLATWLLSDGSALVDKAGLRSKLTSFVTDPIYLARLPG